MTCSDRLTHTVLYAFKSMWNDVRLVAVIRG